MSGIITLIPGDTDLRPEIVNGNERSEENNRSRMNPGQCTGHQLVRTGHNNLPHTKATGAFSMMEALKIAVLTTKLLHCSKVLMLQ